MRKLWLLLTLISLACTVYVFAMSDDSLVRMGIAVILVFLTLYFYSRFEGCGRR
jgi:hypothetical protein